MTYKRNSQLLSHQVALAHAVRRFHVWGEADTIRPVRIALQNFHL